MNKKKAISIITKAARLYHENLEDQKVLFIYGIPSEIRKHLEDGSDTISGFSFYETYNHYIDIWYVNDRIVLRV